MESYNRSSHAVYRCERHFVWAPQYRRHVLVKELKLRLKEMGAAVYLSLAIKR
jgi:REP element-mobilizing transposase RayT